MNLARTAKKTRLAVDNYIADLTMSTRGGETLFSYAIKRVGSAEIIDRGEFPTFEGAKEGAQAVLYDLAKRDIRGKGEAAK